MLTLTHQQLEAFEQYRREDFIHRAVLHLEGSYGQIPGALPKKETRVLVERGIASAKRYQIEKETHVIAYIGWMIRFGEDFDSLPWAKEILDHPRGDADWIIEKLQAISGRIKK